MLKCPVCLTRSALSEVAACGCAAGGACSCSPAGPFASAIQGGYSEGRLGVPNAWASRREGWDDTFMHSNQPMLNFSSTYYEKKGPVLAGEF